MARPDVVAVGDVMVDVTVGWDALAEGGHVHGQVSVRPGGSAANAAVWARAAGGSASVVGRVGDDLAGRALAAELDRRGVETRLAVDPEAPTGTVADLGGTIVAERGATARLAVADLPERLTAGAVLISGYVLLHDDSGPAALAALERADSEWVGVDAASARLLDRYGVERFLAATERATILFANEDEARTLTGLGPEAAARELAGSYRLVCVKRGAAGAVAASGTYMETCAGPTVAVVNSAGAGDAFAGVLLVSFSRGASLAEALVQACQAGAAAAGSPASWP